MDPFASGCGTEKGGGCQGGGFPDGGCPGGGCQGGGCQGGGCQGGGCEGCGGCGKGGGYATFDDGSFAAQGQMMCSGSMMGQPAVDDGSGGWGGGSGDMGSWGLGCQNMYGMWDGSGGCSGGYGGMYPGYMQMQSMMKMGGTTSSASKGCGKGGGKGPGGSKGSSSPVMPGDWMCPQCGDHVFARNAACRRCGQPRASGGGAPDVPAAFAGGGGGGGGGGKGKGGGGAPKRASGQKPLPGDWYCPQCNDLQFARNPQCRMCGAAKPDGNFMAPDMGGMGGMGGQPMAPMGGRTRSRSR